MWRTHILYKYCKFGFYVEKVPNKMDKVADPTVYVKMREICLLPTSAPIHIYICT